MIRSSALVACFLAFWACAAAPPPSASAPAAAAAVTALADDYLAGMLERFPETATYNGLPGARHDRLTDNSLEAVRRWDALEDGWYERVRRIDARAVAGTREEVLLGTLLETLEASRAGRVCRGELWPANQLSGWQSTYAYLAQIQPVGTPELREQALTRGRALPGYVDREIANLREGLRLGYSTPRVALERVLGQLDGMVAEDPTKSPFYAPAERDSTPGFRAALAEVIRTGIDPALRRYRDFVRDEYMPRAREAIAVSALPNGEACYRAMIRQYTTLELSPREIYDMGVREIARTDTEMRAIGERSFATGDVPALLGLLQRDPRYTFGSRQELLDSANVAVARAKAALPRWFGILPRAELLVEPYPPFEEQAAPLGSYNPPAEDGSRPGIYRINLFEAEKQPRAAIQSTAFHEATPGHHLQIAIAQELEGTHQLQRLLSSGGFVEGWGLYAERLAEEMGLFSGDLDRMGLLSNEALRAARLVVDPGIHTMGWTRQQAIDYMLRHTAESPASVAVEVDRYIVWPGQATSYMVGRNEIMRLRERARAELGPRFDIREFHDRVLEQGSITLRMLDARIARWIEERTG